MGSFQIWASFLLTHCCTTSDSIWYHETWLNIGWCNGLSPVWCQAITSANADILLTGLSETILSDILIKLKIVIQENAFENAVCKMPAILLPPQSVKLCMTHGCCKADMQWAEQTMLRANLLRSAYDCIIIQCVLMMKNTQFVYVFSQQKNTTLQT